MTKCVYKRLQDLQDFATDLDSATLDLMLLEYEVGITPEKLAKKVTELENWLHAFSESYD